MLQKIVLISAVDNGLLVAVEFPLTEMIDDRLLVKALGLKLCTDVDAAPGL